MKSIFLILLLLIQGCAGMSYKEHQAMLDKEAEARGPWNSCKYDAVEMCSRTFLGMPWDPRPSNHILCRAGDCECHKKLEADSWKNTHVVNGFTEMKPLRTCEEIEGND